MDMDLLRSDLEYQPKQITDIKKFLEIARRKDAKCEPIPQIGQVGRGRRFEQGEPRMSLRSARLLDLVRPTFILF
jgi:hypothetical protein